MNQPPSPPRPPSFFYGWVVLAVSSVALAATSPGQSWVVGLFTLEISESLGLKESTIALCYGIATFAAAFPLLYVGTLADRFGPRIIMGTSALALGLGCVLIGFAAGPISLGVCYFILRFAGQGALGLSSSHSVAMWFERRLGFANGLKAQSMPLAILIAPLGINAAIAALGWGTAYALLGVLVWVAVLPLVVFLHRNRPADIGQFVDGETPPIPAPTAASHAPHARPEEELIAALAVEQPPAEELIEPHDPPAPDEPNFTRTEALCAPAFWIVTGSLVLSALIGTAIVFLVAPILEAAGRPITDAPRVLAALGITSAIATPLAGILTDRYPGSIIIVLANALLALASACLAMSALPWLAEIALATLGFSQALIFIGGTTIVARFFGRPHHGAIRSAQTFFMVAGTSVGPVLTTSLAEATGYRWALLILGVSCLPGVIAGCFLRTPRTPRR
ncbi:MAG: MFS transporter [Planctomycetota bacterium]